MPTDTLQAAADRYGQATADLEAARAELYTQIRAALADGQSKAEVARKTGLSRETIGAMRADKPMSGRLAPPDRPAVCAHDVRGPLRQACCCCGACDHLDFRVTDETWRAVVPESLDGGHVCLRCFDALAAERGVNYADALTELCFVGDAAVLSFRPVSTVNVA